MESIDYVVKRLPNKWDSIMSMYIKSSDSVALPLYVSLKNRNDEDSTGAKVKMIIEIEIETFVNPSTGFFCRACLNVSWGSLVNKHISLPVIPYMECFSGLLNYMFIVGLNLFVQNTKTKTKTKYKIQNTKYKIQNTKTKTNTKYKNNENAPNNCLRSLYCL